MKVLEEVDNHVDEFGADPNILQKVIQSLDKLIKRDRATKLSVFFTGLSARLEEPLNLFLRGPSSVGKTYNVTKTLRVFPQEDVWYLGGLSPKALVHDHGVLIGRDGEEIDFDERPDKNASKEDKRAWREKLRGARYLVDLQGKILVFLEAPHIETYNMLRPILSHDKWEISYKFTDKSAKGRLKTMHVVIQGWPATIFCTAEKRYMEELATRSFTVSPEETSEKYKEANELTTLKNAFPWLYQNGEQEETLRFFIKKLWLATRKVIVPFVGLENVFPAEIPRDMRDYEHFIQFVKAVTALHYMQRPIVAVGKPREAELRYLATAQDVWIAYALYYQIFETTRTGLQKHILDFYHQIIKGGKEWYVKQLVTEYNKTFKPKRSQRTIRRYLKCLEDIGYVDSSPSEVDKRLIVFRPLISDSAELLPIMDISKMATILNPILEKGFETWRKNIVDTHVFYLYNCYEDYIHQKTCDWQTLQQKILYVQNDLVSTLFLNGKNSFSEKKKLEIMNISEMSKSVNNLGENTLKKYIFINRGKGGKKRK